MNEPDSENEQHSEEAAEEVSAEAGSNGDSQREGSSLSQHSQHISASWQFTGPIPPPGIIGQYNSILPGAADRILSMAEKEQEHRHKMQEKLVDSQVLDQKQQRGEKRLGQFFGFIIGVVSIVGGSWTAVSSSSIATSVAGGFIGSSGVVALVSVFVYGRREEQNDQYGKLESSDIEDE